MDPHFCSSKTGWLILHCWTFLAFEIHEPSTLGYRILTWTKLLNNTNHNQSAHLNLRFLSFHQLLQQLRKDKRNLIFQMNCARIAVMVSRCIKLYYIFIQRFICYYNLFRDSLLPTDRTMPRSFMPFAGVER